jgi:hypothetical protein
MPASQEITAPEASACQSYILFSRIQNGEVHESGEEELNRCIENKKSKKYFVFVLS